MDNNERVEKINEIKAALKKAKQENETRMIQRYLAILLYLKGNHNQDEIAEIVVISKRTVYYYISAYEKTVLTDWSL